MVILKKIVNIIIYFFALIGLILTCGFFAIRLHLTDTKGAEDANNNYFQTEEENFKKEKNLGVLPNSDNELSELENLDKEILKLEKIKKNKLQIYCQINTIADFFPLNAKFIYNNYEIEKNDSLTTMAISAINLQLQENKDWQEKFNNCEKDKYFSIINLLDLKNKLDSTQNGKNAFFWANSEEWASIKEATAKDKTVIEKASQQANIDQRLLVSCLIGEQLRLFHSQRELFKKFFEPLKILGNANKISLGVMGIKEATAEQVEKNLKNSASPYYLGKEYENILNEPTNKSRYEKLTDESHYFSYLYGALYIKQIMKQWKDAGYDISDRPEIVGTLFNVGFPQSKPKSDPKVGGSNIKINGIDYSFGRLAYEFYYSGEISETYPYIIKQ